jgi:hypothetical protein
MITIVCKPIPVIVRAIVIGPWSNDRDRIVITFQSLCKPKSVVIGNRL